MESQGGVALRLKVGDVGEGWDEPRRLKVMVAVYTMNRFGGPHEFILARTSPVVITPAGVERREHAVGFDIPMLKGRYSAFVFVCDPDSPFEDPRFERPVVYPEAEHFPGLPLRTVVCNIEVK